MVVLAYAEQHGLKPAARHFALSRTTVREWRDRHRAHGFPGLLPRYPKRRRRRVAAEVIPLVTVARTEHRFEAWEHRYNQERFSMALSGHTLREILAAKLSARADW